MCKQKIFLLASIMALAVQPGHSQVIGGGSSVIGGGGIGATSAQVAAAAAYPQFIPENDFDSSLNNAGCVVNGKLIGYAVYQKRLTIYDGVMSIQGGVVTGSTGNLWTDGTRVYTPVTGYNKAVIQHGAVTNGPYVVGETVTQATTGAVGWVISDNGTEMVVAVKYASAAFSHASNYTLTGGTSTATSATVSGTGVVTTTSKSFLMVHNTPSSDAYAIIELYNGAPMYGASFVDCGVVDYGVGGTKKTLLFFCHLPGYIPCVVALFPDDDGPNAPTVLFQASETLNVITHWHGAAFFTDVGGVADNDLLVAYSGDGEHTAGIYLCDDVADFVTNPSTWATRWAMSLTGTARSAVLNAADYPYAIGTTARYSSYPSLKPLAMVPNANNSKAYYIADLPGVGTYTHCVEVNFLTRSARVIKDNLIGIGGGGIRTSNGDMLLFMGSEFGGGGSPYSFSDGYNRIYAVKSDGSSIQEIYRWLRRETALGVTPSTGAVYVPKAVEYPVTSTNAASRIFVNSPSQVLGSQLIAGRVVQPNRDNARTRDVNVPTADFPLVNLLPNGMGDRTYMGSTRQKLSHWAETLCAGSRETGTVDSDRSGIVSIKVTPSGSGESYLRHVFKAQTLNLFKGRFITVSGRIKLPASGSVGTIKWYDGVNEQTAGAAHFDSTSTAWQTITMEAFVSPAATAGYLTLYARASGSGTDPVYFSDVSIVGGCYQGRVPVKIPNIDQLLDQDDGVQRGYAEIDKAWFGGASMTEIPSYANVIKVVGTGATTAVIVPVRGGRWLIVNGTDNTITISGTSITVAAGNNIRIWSDGTTFYAE